MRGESIALLSGVIVPIIINFVTAGKTNVIVVSWLALAVIAWRMLVRQSAAENVNVDQTAQQLLVAVELMIRKALQRAAHDVGNSPLADVGFERIDTIITVWRTAGGGESGTLSRVLEYYQSLGTGRLVITGTAASGKTVLAWNLAWQMLQVLKNDHKNQRHSESGIPVPISLPGLQLRSSSIHAPAVEPQELIAHYISFHYGIELAAARELLRRNYVLPVLDGLEHVTEGRARNLIARLNDMGTPVIVTCSTERYHVLTNTSRGGRGVLQDATVIVVRPLTVQQVISALKERFPSPCEPTELQARWQPIAKFLSENPESTLANLLSAPQSLALVMTVYHDDNPKVLLGMGEASLRDHLYERLIPVLAEQHNSSGVSYCTQTVRRWLTIIAQNTEAVERQFNQPRTTESAFLDFWSRYLPSVRKRPSINDTSVNLARFYQHELWVTHSITVRTVISIFTFLICGSFSVFALYSLNKTLTPTTTLSNVMDPARESASYSVVLLCSLAILVWATTESLKRWKTLLQLDTRGLAVSRSRKREIVGMAIVYSTLISVLLITIQPRIKLELNLGDAISMGVLVGTLLAFVIYLGNPSPPARRPSDPLRRAFWYLAVEGLLFGIGTSAVCCIPILGRNPSSLADDIGLIVSGFTSGLMLSFTRSPISRYLLMTIPYYGLERLPRLSQFIDWCYDADILKMVGSGTEFSYAEFRHYLCPEGGAMFTDRR